MRRAGVTATRFCSPLRVSDSEGFPVVVEVEPGWPTTTPAAPGSDPHRVVFVCEHGSVKSLVATLYFNQRAQLRGLRYTAVARGTSPQAAVPASVQLALRADGFDVDHYVPQPFSTKDVDKASLVVSFDQDTTNTVAGRVSELRWDNLPSVLADYMRGRDEILERVDGLIEELMEASRESS
jgi:protein-tyrosine-phosphatase